MSVALLAKSPTYSINEIFSEHMNTSQFLKQIIPCVICTVLNRRCVINQDYIKVKKMEDTQYVAFRSIMPKEHCVYQLFRSFEELGNFIKQKYLQEIIIRIENRETEELQEELILMFKYNSIERSEPYTGESAIHEAAKFFRKINMISTDNCYLEDEIKITFGFRFNESVPKNITSNKDLIPMKWPKKVKITKIASLQAMTCEVDVLQSLPEDRQENAINTNILEIENVQDEATNQEEAREDSAERGSQESASTCLSILLPTNSEEFASLKMDDFDLLNAKLVSPRHLRTPKIRSKYVRKMIQSETKKGSKHPKKSGKCTSPTTTYSSGSDFLRYDW